MICAFLYNHTTTSPPHDMTDLQQGNLDLYTKIEGSNNQVIWALLT